MFGRGDRSVLCSKGQSVQMPLPNLRAPFAVYSGRRQSSMPQKLILLRSFIEERHSTPLLPECQCLPVIGDAADHATAFAECTGEAIFETDSDLSCGPMELADERFRFRIGGSVRIASGVTRRQPPRNLPRWHFEPAGGPATRWLVRDGTLRSRWVH